MLGGDRLLDYVLCLDCDILLLTWKSRARTYNIVNQCNRKLANLSLDDVIVVYIDFQLFHVNSDGV
jgi:hypothetical protein